MPTTKAQNPDRKPGPVPPLPGYYEIINTVPSPAGDDLTAQFNGNNAPLTVVPFNVDNKQCSMRCYCLVYPTHVLFHYSGG
ncbi:hypothetical protein BS47DRAFT_1335398 [Hydnum rufescens UP504]|uniref:Uncharacterized protein n=1 Tax=Hydnum rufescens UP504 TaxID=1448309 RepID=A0A9P6E2Q2_9AGAM|nr:hypothetical protein BS47DRAFT_1335398 [Hydnum rufescens UP504]